MQGQSYKQDYDLNWITLSGFFNPNGRTVCTNKYQFMTTQNALLLNLNYFKTTEKEPWRLIFRLYKWTLKLIQ